MATTPPSIEPDQMFEADYNHLLGEARCIDWDKDRVGGRPDSGDHKSTMAWSYQVIRGSVAIPGCCFL
jgi:hypothetical protein